jgi:hypothetical protein
MPTKMSCFVQATYLRLNGAAFESRLSKGNSTSSIVIISITRSQSAELHCSVHVVNNSQDDKGAERNAHRDMVLLLCKRYEFFPPNCEAVSLCLQRPHKLAHRCRVPKQSGRQPFERRTTYAADHLNTVMLFRVNPPACTCPRLQLQTAGARRTCLSNLLKMARKTGRKAI